MIVVVVHAENVCDSAFPVGPPCAGVQPLRVCSSGQRRKRIHDVARAARPVQPEIDIVLRTPSASAATITSTASDDDRTESGTAACPEVVDQPENHRIGAARSGSYVMKVLPGSRRPKNIRRGDEF